ncbi:MAG: T9SS type A sorting domain-containing protein, partial [Bacteroidota bacterium]
EYLIGSKGKLLNIYSNSSGKESFKTVDVLSKITTIAVDKVTSSVPKILIGTNDGFGFAVRADDLLSINQFVPADYTFYKGNDAVINFGVAGNYYTILLPKNFIVRTTVNIVSSFGLDSKKAVLTKDSNGRYVSIILLNENTFLMATEGTIISSFQVKSKTTINSFAVADLYKDGQNYILVSNGSFLEAYNFIGAAANNFPFEEPNGENFIGTPLAVDLDNDGFAEVIAFTDKGKVYAINAVAGKVVDGFPLSSGAQSAATSILFGEELPTAGPIPTYKPYLAVLDQTNQLYVWNLAPTQGKLYWSGEFGDAMNTSFVIGPSTSQQAVEFFPTDKVYNWPNPVYGDETKIRYYVSENSSVRIKIFDIAGELTAEFENRASGGLDNETTWNVSKVQSGVYYAQVEVKGESGNTASKVIKIAVIK